MHLIHKIPQNYFRNSRRFNYKVISTKFNALKNKPFCQNMEILPTKFNTRTVGSIFHFHCNFAWKDQRVAIMCQVAVTEVNCGEVVTACSKSSFFCLKIVVQHLASPHTMYINFVARLSSLILYISYKLVAVDIYRTTIKFNEDFYNINTEHYLKKTEIHCRPK